MSKMKADEMQIVKCVSMKVSDDVVMLVTLQYHTEMDDSTGKVDRTKSSYRWLARVDKIDAIKDMIADMKSDAKRLDPWKWPDDPTWTGKIYTSDSTNYVGASWLATKMKKLVDWETGLKILNGWKKCSNEVKLSAKYETEGYLDPEGNLVNLTDRDALLKLVGKNLVKVQVKKTKNNNASTGSNEAA